MGRKKKKKKWGFAQTRERLIAEGYIEIESPTFEFESKRMVGCTCTIDNAIHIYEADCKLHGNVILR